MNEGTVLKNVNVLDMRNTTQETIDKIAFIKNVNVILVSQETASFLTGIPCKNLNATAQVPQNVHVQTSMSSVTITQDYLQNLTSPQFLLVMGRLLIGPDVTVDAMESKLAGFVSMGKLICPEQLVGVLHSKAGLMMGGTVGYAQDAHLVANSLVLDDPFLNSLSDATKLVVSGSLRVIDNVTSALIDRKLKSLQVQGSILCRQEHELALRSKLEPAPETLTIIPTGHRFVDGTLTLDEASLQALSHERLFSLADIIIKGDIERSVFDTAIDSLSTVGTILCPSRLKEVLSKKCDMLSSRAILYEGTLWYVDDDRELFADQFEYIDGPMTIFVRADLRVESDVSPQLLLDRIDKIHNLGDILCHPEHVAAIEARLGIRAGDLTVIREQEEEQQDDRPSIGNANYMVL